MCWFNHDRSGRYWLIDKIDHLIKLLAKKRGLNSHEFVKMSGIFNVIYVYKLQCMSFMYDLTHNLCHLPHFSIETNSMIRVHNTRRFNNIHVNAISSLDKRNFIYHCILNWNSCLKQYRVRSK